jgi:predicted phage terminase large subunit-like protein
MHTSSALATVSLETELYGRMRNQLAQAAGIDVQASPFSNELPSAESWLMSNFPSMFSIGFAPHHSNLWSWVEALRPGQPARTFIALWSRGGGKSSNAEAVIPFINEFKLRRYGLYVCGVQEQADDHVGNVSTMLENPFLGVERAVGKYGQSRGWRRNRLRTPNFTLDAIGLDTAARGIKIDEDRPDFIVLDDLDSEGDSSSVIRRKILALTRKILPAGSDDLAVLGIQNIPNADGIFAQIEDGRADFLMDRTISGPFPALQDFACETYQDELSNARKYRITNGSPVWEGQDLKRCEILLNLIGLRSFEVECLFKTERLKGDMFQRHWFQIVDDWPRDGRMLRYWDLASTEQKANTDPDWTAGCLMAEKGGQYWIVDMRRFRASPKGVEDRIEQTAAEDGVGVEVWLEQEPGSSGKATVSHYQRNVLKGYTVKGNRETGSKTERAKPLASAAEAGNVMVVKGDWNKDFLDEVEDFPVCAHDDQVDSASGAQRSLTSKRKHSGTWGR